MDKRKKGALGEDVAVTFLVNKGFTIVERNYLKKWGEIDIVAQRQSKLHFFEVKSVTRPFSDNGQSYKPEDNVHGLKVRHLRRIIETYLMERVGKLDVEFEFHVLCVFVNLDTRKGRVKWLQNMIL